ncbi:unannotated protein [freshwater metagenome]|uniref:Unannotated protein n=1 Tax=freshwater metagenome TaxID=449393 RepID=A0A6J7RWD6_9ZZZZ
MPVVPVLVVIRGGRPRGCGSAHRRQVGAERGPGLLDHEVAAVTPGGRQSLGTHERHRGRGGSRHLRHRGASRSLGEDAVDRIEQLVLVGIDAVGDAPDGGGNPGLGMVIEDPLLFLVLGLGDDRPQGLPECLAVIILRQNGGRMQLAAGGCLHEVELGDRTGRVVDQRELAKVVARDPVVGLGKRVEPFALDDLGPLALHRAADREAGQDALADFRPRILAIGGPREEDADTDGLLIGKRFDRDGLADGLELVVLLADVPAPCTERTY